MAQRETHSHDNHNAGTQTHSEHVVKDPVCGMTVDPHTAKHWHTHDGRPYYFCSGKCRETFIADPAKYLVAERRQAAPVAAGTIYTCPMHPEIRQEGSG